ncbi:MAG: hypothetical protein SPJ13_00480 [Bacteroidales bacterium]|nr:hypothetical protein [Bacteroidales bacterium]
MTIKNFLIRASYPNYYMVNLFATNGYELFNHDNDAEDNPLEGNKPGTVMYTLEEVEGRFEFPPRWYDMYFLMKQHGEGRRNFLSLLLQEKYGESLHDGPGAKGCRIPQLDAMRDAFLKQCRDYVNEHPLQDTKHIITTLNPKLFTDQNISHKGRMLMDLTRNCYPVPDFCIVTADGVQQANEIPKLLETAIHNLEIMTNCRLGDKRNPLIFAIRCAMPQYIPGLMPTILNIGTTRNAYQGMLPRYGRHMANRVYLSMLHTLEEMLGIERRYKESDIKLDEEEQEQRIQYMEMEITAAREDGERLLTDAHYQTLQLVRHVLDFYDENQNLILTFMQGKKAVPSLILHRMVWTIGNEGSYPGVLYSRHSRTGKGRQIETYRNIFGEEIMTGDVTSEDIAYTDRAEIRRKFPAVYHFDPLLHHLEHRYKSPVTIEFAVETRPHMLSLFSVLQLNLSEMTGRAALVSAVDLYNDGQITATDATDIIKPYHLHQIVSASIDDASFTKLQLFSKALSVLPRTATTAVLCFSIAHARKMKANGENVCLCQERFVPEDTIVLNEVDAIISMSPAAIHVVTACRGYGIPAFMDLLAYGVRMEGDKLINPEGVVLHELDKITLSSRRQTIYKGVAAFRPARFTKYLHGEKVELNEEEKVFFEEMKQSYETYQQIIMGSQVAYITDINKLARIIRVDMRDKPKMAGTIVNNWYQQYSDLYIRQVLESRMGDHQDQSRVFDLLTNSHKAGFFKRVMDVCVEEGRSGLKAGSFMIGRFVAKPLPIAVWNTLSDANVAFLLNEYVLYEKYLHVLEDVGEIKVARAHSRIETEGIDNMFVENFNLYTFVPLLYATHSWANIAKELEHIEHQENTHLLVQKLSHPIGEIFDLSKPWNVSRIEDLLKQMKTS